jgi:NAD(P)H dehydrogenase (quinone)
MLAITGATGQLGQRVIHHLLERVDASELVALARDPARAASLAARGVQVRQADYEQPRTLAAGLRGVDRLLLISSSEVGRRTAQHRAIIDAAKEAGVRLIAYTSILHADTSPLPLAAEHVDTEALLRASNIDHVLLRNGWYTENYLASVPAALAHGALFGAAANGQIASAARDDYALAAAVVMSSQAQAGKVYELAGDEAYTLAGFAAELARQTGKPIAYRDLPQLDFKAALLAAGLPEGVASLLAESDGGASQGGLFDDSRQLSQLIGRPTTPLATLIHSTLKGNPS